MIHYSFSIVVWNSAYSTVLFIVTGNTIKSLCAVLPSHRYHSVNNFRSFCFKGYSSIFNYALSVLYDDNLWIVSKMQQENSDNVVFAWRYLVFTVRHLMLATAATIRRAAEQRATKSSRTGPRPIDSSAAQTPSPPAHRFPQQRKSRVNERYGYVGRGAGEGWSAREVSCHLY